MLHSEVPESTWNLRVHSWQGLGVFLSTTVSRLALPPSPPASCPVGTRALSLGVKQLGHEANHSPPTSAKVKGGAIPSLLQYIFMAWCLVKHRDNFTFTCLLAAVDVAFVKF